MKYVAVKWIEDDCPPSDYKGTSPSNLQVDDQKVTYTGIMDINENPICRIQPPIGFGRDEEW